MPIFIPNTGKYESKKIPLLDTFHAVCQVGYLTTSSQNKRKKRKNDDHRTPFYI